MLKDKIRQIRTEKRLSQSELARRSGHAVSTIHGIENGNNKNPSFKMIGDIAQVLGIPLDELYRECKEGCSVDELNPCPICHVKPKIGYACGEYFTHCSEGCSSPMCSHSSESATASSWNDWVERHGSDCPTDSD